MRRQVRMSTPRKWHGGVGSHGVHVEGLELNPHASVAVGGGCLDEHAGGCCLSDIRAAQVELVYPAVLCCGPEAVGVCWLHGHVLQRMRNCCDTSPPWQLGEACRKAAERGRSARIQGGVMALVVARHPTQRAERAPVLGLCARSRWVCSCGILD